LSQRISAGYRVDIHANEAAAAGETTLRLNLVAAWRHPREALAGPGGLSLQI
jgi:hypothetical protein